MVLNTAVFSPLSSVMEYEMPSLTQTATFHRSLLPFTLMSVKEPESIVSF